MTNRLRDFFIAILTGWMCWTLFIGQIGIIGAGHVIGNPTGSAAAPTDAALTGIIDNAFCNTQGDIIRRGSSWNCSNPPTTVAYTSHGTYTFTVPPGVYTIYFSGTGAGSGSGAVGFAATCLVVGTPGYNGETAFDAALSVNPGDTISIVIGTGGIAGVTTGISTCVAGNSGTNAGGIGGDTTVTDTTTSTTLLTLKGGVVGSSQAAQVTTSATGFAHYEGNIGQAGFAYNVTGPVGIGWYWAPTPFFPMRVNISTTGNFAAPAAMFGNNFVLAAEPGLYPGQGASSSISINAAAAGAGAPGHDGAGYLSY